MKQIKQYWLRLSAKVDVLSLRERMMAFAIAALLIVSLVDSLVLSPLLNTQKQLSQQIRLNQQQIAAMQGEITILASGRAADPDAAGKARLREMKRQSEKLREELAGAQQSLVPPERMATLLEDILRRNRNLQLISLKTLPVTLLTEPELSSAGKPAAAGNVPPRQERPKLGDANAGLELVYRHGFELVVRGSYADITNYLSQLEGMPWRLFWARSRLNADDYPKVSLTLTLFTLSLDKKWLNI